MTAAAAPAAPYEPVVCCTSSTMEIVSIANGWRAAKPGSRNVQAPRVRSSRPYPGRAEAVEFSEVFGFRFSEIFGFRFSEVCGFRDFFEVTVDATARAFLPPGSATRSAGGAESCPLARNCGRCRGPVRRGDPTAIRSRQLCVRQSWFDLG
ncbi:hypothetical protein GCM10023086_35890 [Streptomyces venetus]|uniref:Uncharacterized protein n=1 Tax=Streptomyces venetus TaxID=1701086 RepID=A0ABP8G047_9ACTN